MYEFHPREDKWSAARIFTLTQPYHTIAISRKTTSPYDMPQDGDWPADILHVLKSMGFKKMLCQIGNGQVVPEEGVHEGIAVEYFRFRDSLQADMEASSLVISHAGAGSCLEALEAKKPLVVVVNERLMDNHQTELAQQLHADGYAYYCTCNDLKETLREINLKSLKQFPMGNPKKMVDFVNDIFGFS